MAPSALGACCSRLRYARSYASEEPTGDWLSSTGVDRPAACAGEAPLDSFMAKLAAMDSDEVIGALPEARFPSYTTTYAHTRASIARTRTRPFTHAHTHRAS